MKRLFADAYYFFAIVNEKSNAHATAVGYSHSHLALLITTAWVLTEVADGLAKTRNRHLFVPILRRLTGDPDDVIVPASAELFHKGVSLYDARRDKQWSLTDCISFVVMQAHGITEALTGDHFEQAGFVALLK
jgi:predicted nucleic acid-binding protein